MPRNRAADSTGSITIQECRRISHMPSRLQSSECRRRMRKKDRKIKVGFVPTGHSDFDSITFVHPGVGRKRNTHKYVYDHRDRPIRWERSKIPPTDPRKTVKNSSDPSGATVPAVEKTKDGLRHHLQHHHHYHHHQGGRAQSYAARRRTMFLA